MYPREERFFFMFSEMQKVASVTLVDKPLEENSTAYLPLQPHQQKL